MFEAMGLCSTSFSMMTAPQQELQSQNRCLQVETKIPNHPRRPGGPSRQRAFQEAAGACPKGAEAETVVAGAAKSFLSQISSDFGCRDLRSDIALLTKSERS
jgi:hypothetical protein